MYKEVHERYKESVEKIRIIEKEPPVKQEGDGWTNKKVRTIIEMRFVDVKETLINSVLKEVKTYKTSITKVRDCSCPEAPPGPPGLPGPPGKAGKDGLQGQPG